MSTLTQLTAIPLPTQIPIGILTFVSAIVVTLITGVFLLVKAWIPAQVEAFKVTVDAVQKMADRYKSLYEEERELHRNAQQKVSELNFNISSTAMQHTAELVDLRSQLVAATRHNT